MRTVEEIVKRVDEIRSSDFFGFESGDLIICLPFEHARKYLKEDATEDKWDPLSRYHESITKEIIEYLPFAFGKAQDHRGLSAGRSISHMRAWFWLLEDDEALKFIEDEGNYQNYGAPILVYCAKRIGAPIPDDPALQRMAEGNPCTPDCQMGCGT